VHLELDREFDPAGARVEARRFDVRFKAAQGLAGPSSAARALYAGALNIERVDRLVRTIAAQKGMRSAEVDEIVALVDAKLEENRRAVKK